MMASSRIFDGDDAEDSFLAPDYLITDSLYLAPEDRPSVLKSASNPRDALAFVLVVVGMAVSVCNVLGEYGETYDNLTLLSVALGGLSCVVSFLPLAFPQSKLAHVMGGGLDGRTSISPNQRLGVVDDAVIHAYAAVYTGAASWLALRLSPACPPGWTDDSGGIAAAIVPLVASGIFAFSLLAPVVTLWEDRVQREKEEITTTFSAFETGENGEGLCTWMVRLARWDSAFASLATQRKNDDIQGNARTDMVGSSSLLAPLPIMTETEVLRARGLLAIGVLGCLFLPECLFLTFRGQEWWGRALEAYPSQGLLESSTALFALYATEASMVSHRAAKNGVAPLTEVVPFFGLVCLVVAIVPCVCALYWLRDDVTFYQAYFL